MPHNESPYVLVPATLNIYSDSVTFDIKNKHNGHLFVVKVEGVKVRFQPAQNFDKFYKNAKIMYFLCVCPLERHVPFNSR